MKSAIEFYLLMLVFMVLCIFGIESAAFISQINRVHLFRDYVVNTIDNNHTYDDEVHKSLMNTNLCPSCSYRIQKYGNRYEIEVYSHLYLDLLDVRVPLRLKTYSNMIF